MKRIILLTGILTAAVACLVTGRAHAQNTTQPMKPEITYLDAYPVFITKDLIGSRDFYTNNLGFEVAFESGFFILLTTSAEPSYRIGFLGEEHPSAPPSAPALQAGAGVFLTLQVQDAKATFEKLVKAGVKITYTLTDEPWGQRRFGVTDPNGMYVDVVEQTEPQEGFWEKHPPKE